MWSFSLGVAANDDWDLGAVVRSCRPSGAAAVAARCNSSCFPPPTSPVEAGEQEVAVAEAGKGGSFVGFPDLLRTRDGVQELEELCRPFFPRVQQQLPPPPRACSSSPSPADAAAAGPHQSPSSRQAHRPLSQTPRSKRRKNQQKKVVCHVPADRLSSDVWAWRKYGQKPIKGSPYPRGYYRCSSSKGCLARKQVERSRTDPAVFIITYTAEHNHPVPTHRNSLAGSSRHKFPSAAPASAAAGGVDEGGGPPPPGNPSVSPPSSSTATGLSPTTPLTASMEDELLLRRRQSQEGEDGDDDDDEEEEEDDRILLVEDMDVMDEDDLLFTSSGADGAVGAASSSVEAEAAAAFLDGDGGVGDHCFPPAWSRQS